MIKKKWSTIKHKFASSFILFDSFQNSRNNFQENTSLHLFTSIWRRGSCFFGFWPSTVLGLAWDVLQMVRLFLTKILTRVRSKDWLMILHESQLRNEKQNCHIVTFNIDITDWLIDWLIDWLVLSTWVEVCLSSFPGCKFFWIITHSPQGDSLSW